MAAAFGISKPSIFLHLDLLKGADLVSSVKKGQFMVYSLNTTILEEVMNN
ncbi:MAG: ArsR family transcriptional regulator [Flavobacteriales bacterium]|jgi:DNA-binding transcriptional ArsR family regulator